jgi:hypothetical protein
MPPKRADRIQDIERHLATVGLSIMLRAEVVRKLQTNADGEEVCNMSGGFF